jgi:hypothetical protein
MPRSADQFWCLSRQNAIKDAKRNELGAGFEPAPFRDTSGQENYLPLRNDGRWRWRLAFAHLGIGGNAEESKHRGRC